MDTLRAKQGKLSADAEVERQIMLLETPIGDGPHQRDRERAAAWLIANADSAYPLLVSRIEDGHATVAVIEILPRFGRADSISLLERLLTAPEPTAWAAGQALALFPQAAAGDILQRSVASKVPAVAIIAADALATRGDRGACTALGTAMNATDPTVRYHVVQAAGKLNCLAREALETLARTDADADVRGLADRLLGQMIQSQKR